MKKFFSIIATGSLLTLMAVAAQAQMPGAAMRASIPFDFIVRGRTLPQAITRSGESTTSQVA